MTQVANRCASGVSQNQYVKTRLQVVVCVCVYGTGLNQLAGNKLSLDLLPSQTSTGMIATEITYIGEWAFTQYRRNAQFLSKI